MGWYHTMDPEEIEEMKKAMGTDAPACSIASRPPSGPPSANSTEGDTTASTDEKVISGNTACPLPPSSLPPPPPPDAGSLYHLCQKSMWEEALKAKEPYFPPTFMADGKFTRGSLYKADLVSTANIFYKDVPGAWIVLEIDCKTLFGLGIPILAQDAPESTEDDQVKCLQVFGGISTTHPGLITNIYDMERLAISGKFLSMTIKKEPKKPTPPEKIAQPPAEQAKKSKKSKGIFGFLKTKNTTLK
jgi:hypothetical protein